ncbi:MAG: MgtC/SapB family protein [Synechococcales bacterium]|nr:MgtC/SapB family protein [Synechococcales bacterium]
MNTKMLSLLDPMPWSELFLRLGCALLAGAVIGAEREGKDKPAGLRTNMLASFGSAMFVLISIQTGAAQQNLEVISRVIQGVVAGIGFLGAGTIMRHREIQGLTSAAAVWVSASLGVAASCGLWQLSLAGAAITWLVLRVIERFEKKVF